MALRAPTFVGQQMETCGDGWVFNRSAVSELTQPAKEEPEYKSSAELGKLRSQRQQQRRPRGWQHYMVEMAASEEPQEQLARGNAAKINSYADFVVPKQQEVADAWEALIRGSSKKVSVVEALPPP